MLYVFPVSAVYQKAGMLAYVVSFYGSRLAALSSMTSISSMISS